MGQCFVRQDPRISLVRQDSRIKIITKNIADLLEQMDETIGKENRVAVSKTIFMLLVKNKWFLESHPKFSDVVRRKLIEFHPQWNMAMFFGKELFPDEDFFKQQPIDEFKQSLREPRIVPSAPPMNDINPFFSDKVGANLGICNNYGSFEANTNKLKLKENKECGLCQICFDNKLDTLLMPCKHTYYCSECALKLVYCSICNCKIDTQIKIFTPF